MLKVEGLRAGYGRLTALGGIDLAVGKGEIVFVVGPNGAPTTVPLSQVADITSRRRSGRSAPCARSDVSSWCAWATRSGRRSR